jgi:hypothetical protein
MRRLMTMILSLGVLVSTAHAATQRFGKTVIPVRDPQNYKVTRLDDMDFPVLERDSAAVSVVVYRGPKRYYIEVTVTNRTGREVVLDKKPIAMSKPGYTIYETDVMEAAREASEAAGVKFQPAPPPPPGYRTTVKSTETTQGSTTKTTATATSKPTVDLGSALGYALGSSIEKGRVERQANEARRFSDFLSTHAVSVQNDPLPPGETRVMVATFEQAKPKKAPFQVTVKACGQEFVFQYAE